MPGHSRRKWSSFHNRQGNLTFRGGAEGGSTSGVLGVGARGILVTSPLGDFFFLVFFFFFLATWLLELSPGEVEDEDPEIGEEGERSTLEST